MKNKWLLLLSLLPVVFVCCFAGCSGSKSEGSAKKEAEAISQEVKKSVQERLDAGEDVSIGYVVNTLSNPFLKLVVDYIQGNMEEMGVSVSVMACEGDNSLMISHIENFIAMNVDLIICAPIDQEAIKSVCLQAMDAGIPVVFNGQYPSYHADVSGGAAVEYYRLGVEVANMGSKWIDQAYPDAGEGDIHAAVLGFNNMFFCKKVYDAILDTVEGDPRIQITYTGQAHNSIDLGYNAAEEAMTMDPEIRLFMAYQEPPAVGINNYITSQPNFDLSEFAVFAGSYSDGTSKPLIESSVTNESVLRGSCNYGTYGQTVKVFFAEGLYQVAKRVLFDEVETPFWVLDDIWTVDAIGYDFLLDNPENNFLMH